MGSAVMFLAGHAVCQYTGIVNVATRNPSEENLSRNPDYITPFSLTRDQQRKLSLLSPGALL